jgi:hypothetical protein
MEGMGLERMRREKDSAGAEVQELQWVPTWNLHPATSAFRDRAK